MIYHPQKFSYIPLQLPSLHPHFQATTDLFYVYEYNFKKLVYWILNREPVPSFISEKVLSF